MSLQKISLCSQLFSTKTHGYHHGRCLLQLLSELTRTKDALQLSRFHSTDLRPKNITSSLHRWKKKKRKSKAQQKRELENLQEDLVKILSKRVVRLVQDNSLLSAHRDVVTTYSFTHLLRKDGESDPYASNLEPLGIDGKPGLNPTTASVGSSHLGEKDVDCSPSEELLSADGRINDPLLSSSLVQNINETVKMFLERGAFPREISDISTPTFNGLSDIPQLSDVFSSVKQEKMMKPSMALPMKSVVPRQELAKSFTKDNDLSSSVLNETFAQALQKLEQGLTKANTSEGRFFWEEAIEESSSSVCDKIYVEQPLELDISEIEPKPLVAKQKKSEELLGDNVPSPSAATSVGKASRQKPDTGARMSLGQEIKKSNPKFKEFLDMAYIDVCCFSECDKLAVRYLKTQASKGQCPSVAVFNKVIHALARKQNMVAVKSVFSLLRQKKLMPTLQTYAGCLECIGRMSDPDLILCEKLVAEIEKSEHDLANIASTCSFEGDQWEHVLKAIHLVHPNFEPHLSPIENDYKADLLLPLNTPNPERLENNQYSWPAQKEEVMKRLSHQMNMEKEGLVEIPSIAIMSDKEKKKWNMLTEKQERLKGEWRRTFCDIFSQHLQTMEKKANNNLKMTIYPYLKLFPPEIYTDIMIRHLEELSFLYDEMFSPTQVSIQMSLGRAVNYKYNMRAKLMGRLDEKVTKIYDRYLDQHLDPAFPLDNHRLMWTRAMKENYDTAHLDTSVRKWPPALMKGVGKFMLDLVIQNLKINANEFRTSEAEKLVPAFCTIFRPDVTTYTAAELKFHPVVSRMFGSRFRKSFTFDPSIVPMVVPPVPWVSKTMGSLLLGSNPLVRMSDESRHMDPLEDVKDTQYSAVLDSLNALSACAWKINTRILDLQMKIFNEGGDTKLKVAPPSINVPPLPKITSDMNMAEKASLYRERRYLLQQKNEMHSLWCTDLYRLSIANMFRDETFWFPHSMDFRGRTYPLPPHFNHLGSDNVRSMLLFEKGKPLGKEGHDWLKIHLVNLTGLKKRCSNAERLEYADSIMHEILDSADNPRTGNKWWQESDEPWQTLACCMELTNIHRFEGNREDYICHYPVHQDGSCNGLQHYAALGRDQLGAESVNLAPCHQPQDVYSDVVALVEKERKKDAENGIEIAQVLDELVKRKVIKQTVMTTVYGVTRFGAKAQIFKQLKEIPQLPNDLAWKCSIYLTHKTFDCLGQMFTATKDIQDWLTHAARLISLYLAVEWVTPLGFPVIQPYYKKVGGTRGASTKPNVIKQKNSFPPNYIHSLDSTHMMLTSLFCMHAGVTFVSVHDCYWTHACDIPLMNKVCREQFVSMHKQPLLENLAQHLTHVIRQEMPYISPDDPEHLKKMEEMLMLLRCIPKRGKFDLDDVLKSTYFFS